MSHSDGKGGKKPSNREDVPPGGPKVSRTPTLSALDQAGTDARLPDTPPPPPLLRVVESQSNLGTGRDAEGGAARGQPDHPPPYAVRGAEGGAARGTPRDQRPDNRGANPHAGYYMEYQSTPGPVLPGP